MSDKQAVALKRRSVESAEQLLHNRQLDGVRQITQSSTTTNQQQAKSALGHYPTTTTALGSSGG